MDNTIQIAERDDMKHTGPFKRPPRRNTADATGSIRVQITLLHKNGPNRNSAIKGNICKSMIVPDACVSKVFAIVDVALFGDMAI